MARRLELAGQLQGVRPVKVQIDRAIDRYVERQSEATRAVDRMALQKTLNYKAIEKISVDAYAQVFTDAELEAMIAYYSTPESHAAEAKILDYRALVGPEIIRLMDQALIRAKIGGTR